MLSSLLRGVTCRPFMCQLQGNMSWRTIPRYIQIPLRNTTNSAMDAALGATKSSETIPAYWNKYIGRWLMGCSGMVVGAVILGGVTRLTESGLSMVTWKVFGERPPWTDADWEIEFKRYQEHPEFKITNKNMTIREFKRIWWMEYAHRTWGRCIGAAFYVPAAVFWWKGWFQTPTKIRVGVMGSLLAFQGWLGWYMVKSGLEDRFDGPCDIPRVSQYRLAAHLASAFVLYSLLFRSTLDMLLPAEVTARSLQMRRFRLLSHSAKALVFFTAVSGAFVAGLDAGLVYNSFPKMGDNWIPEDILTLNPVMRNFTENPTTVQFCHRLLGISTLSVVVGAWIQSRKLNLPPRIRYAANLVAAAVLLQVALGITTLLNHAPAELAASHQSGSLLLLSATLWLTHELKRLPK